MNTTTLIRFVAVAGTLFSVVGIIWILLSISPGDSIPWTVVSIACFACAIWLGYDLLTRGRQANTDIEVTSIEVVEVFE